MDFARLLPCSTVTLVPLSSPGRPVGGPADTRAVLESLRGDSLRKNLGFQLHPWPGAAYGSEAAERLAQLTK